MSCEKRYDMLKMNHTFFCHSPVESVDIHICNIYKSFIQKIGFSLETSVKKIPISFIVKFCVYIISYS